MNTDHKRAYIAVTESGFKIATALKSHLKGHVLGTKRQDDTIDLSFSNFSDLVDYAFKQYKELVFIMATGIVVRSIAPHVKDKYQDPAIVVVDDLGRHAISLLSGHIGGANALTQEIAALIGANPVITTATDIHGKGALELYLRDRGLDPQPYREISKWANRNLVEGKPLWLIDVNTTLDPPKGFTAGLEEKLDAYPVGQVVYVGDRDTPQLRQRCKALIPTRTLVIGIGFRRGKSESQIRRAIEETLEDHQLSFGAIRSVATIGIKAREAGLIALSQAHGFDIVIVDEGAIKRVQHLFVASDFVEATVGVKCVSEPSAYIASGGKLIVGKQVIDGVTVSVGRVL